MDRLQEKTTAPYPPVGADGGQSLSQKPNQSIAEGVTEHKPPERDLEEILRQISRVNDPAYLPTVSMNDLYEQVYPGRPPVVDGLLYAGTYLFVGAPKVGKSFLMAQLAYHVSMGLSLWGYEVRQGTVLYLALEDNHRSLQERLYRMFGVESTGNLFFAIGAKQLGGGLEEQLKGFVREHTDTRLIIIDTLQKIREAGAEKYSYANDYEVIIIADHGNADHALNEDGTPNTAHSLNPVPFVYVTANKDAKVEDGILADVAPSILHILGLKQPKEMTGKSLIK